MSRRSGRIVCRHGGENRAGWRLHRPGLGLAQDFGLGDQLRPLFGGHPLDVHTADEPIHALLEDRDPFLQADVRHEQAEHCQQQDEENDFHLRPSLAGEAKPVSDLSSNA